MKYTAMIGAMVFGTGLLVPSFSQAQQDQEAPHNYVEEECYVTGSSKKRRCFTLERPMFEGSEEMITIGGVIVSARAATPESDPLLVLAGGPGQAASDMAPAARAFFRTIGNSRDVIFFDQRGSGMSMPVTCTSDDELVPLEWVEQGRAIEEVANCKEENKNLVRGFTTKMAVADIEALREALGIEQFNIWGGSYGTRLAQYYMYEHQDKVRSAILDGVVPFTPSYVKLQPKNAINALEGLRKNCSEDEVCSSSFPNFDPLALIDKVKDGQEISFTHPVTGVEVNTKTSRAVVAQVVFTSLYSPSGVSLIPYALSEAVNNDNWSPFSVLATDMGHYLGIVSIYAGSHLSVTCAEEGQNIKKRWPADDPFFNGYWQSFFAQLCEAWPMKQEELPSPDPASIGVPVLMISGGRDPITPPIMAEHALPDFSNAHHIVLENGGHINSTVKCINDYYSSFVLDPDGERPELKCLSDGYVPAFVVGPNSHAKGGM